MSTGFFDFQERLTPKPAANPAPTNPANALPVSQMTAMIVAAIRGGVPASVLVRGDVTNVSRHLTSGHLYFTLRAPGACISCVMFNREAERLKFAPADGQ